MTTNEMGLVQKFLSYLIGAEGAALAVPGANMDTGRGETRAVGKYQKLRF